MRNLVPAYRALHQPLLPHGCTHSLDGGLPPQCFGPRTGPRALLARAVHGASLSTHVPGPAAGHLRGVRCVVQLRHVGLKLGVAELVDRTCLA
jgi:hypothetical protein